MLLCASHLSIDWERPVQAGDTLRAFPVLLREEPVRARFHIPAMRVTLRVDVTNQNSQRVARVLIEQFLRHPDASEEVY